MSLLNDIEQKIIAAIPDAQVEIKDDSEKHAGHIGYQKGMITHVRLRIISNTFVGIAYVDRHKLIYKILQDELTKGLHALVLKAYTISEYEKRHNKM